MRFNPRDEPESEIRNDYRWIKGIDLPAAKEKQMVVSTALEVNGLY
jgi:hypothetical protein